MPRGSVSVTLRPSSVPKVERVMSEMVMVVPVIAFTIAVGAGILWIFKGYLKQREMISAVKEEAPEVV